MHVVIPSGTNELEMIDQNHCMTGEFLFHEDVHNYTLNSYTGRVMFKGFQNLFSTMMLLDSKDKVATFSKSVEFPQGLNIDYSILESKREAPVNFKGEMRVMGLTCYGEVGLSLKEDNANLEIECPPFKIGGGNLQFIGNNMTNEEGEEVFAETDSEERELRSIYYTNSSLSNNITGVYRKGHLEETVLTFNARARMFNMEADVKTQLNTESFNIEMEGYPFNGLFDAKTTIIVSDPHTLMANPTSRMKMVMGTENEEWSNL